MKRVKNEYIVTVSSGYGTAATVTLDHADASLEELFDAFKGCLVGVSWSEKSVLNYVKEWALEIQDTEDFVARREVIKEEESQGSVYDDAVCVGYYREHADFWEARGLHLAEGAEWRGITSANIWHRIYGGLQHYKELTKEEFEERFYKPWLSEIYNGSCVLETNQQSLDISNA